MSDPSRRSFYPFDCDRGAEFYGTAGRMVVSKQGKVEVSGERDRRIEDARPKEPPGMAGSHQADFLEAIRQGRKPGGDVAIGRDSVALVHRANAAVRLGRTLKLDAVTEQVPGDEEASRLLRRAYRDGGHRAEPRGV